MKNKNAFTLIELLVVVLIMGILASVAMPQYFIAVKKSRMMGYSSVSKSLKDAQEAHFMQKGSFAATLNDLSVDVPYKEGCSYKTQYSGSFYECKDGKLFGIFNSANAQAGEADIRYVQVYKDYFDNGVHFHADDIACFSKGNVARQACKSLGGREHKAIGWDYIVVISPEER